MYLRRKRQLPLKEWLSCENLGYPECDPGLQDSGSLFLSQPPQGAWENAEAV